MRRTGIEPGLLGLKSTYVIWCRLTVDKPPDRGDILFYIQIISKMGEINNKHVWELRDSFVL